MKLKFVKIRDVQDPIRAHKFDAGIDFFIPKYKSAFFYLEGTDTDLFMIPEIGFELQPGNSMLIPSGIKLELPSGFCGLFMNKSSIASKYSVICGAAVVDEFYSGEVHFDLHNIGKETIIIRPNQKIIQMLIVPIAYPSLIEIKENELYKNMSGEDFRGSNGFGSTNKT